MLTVNVIDFFYNKDKRIFEKLYIRKNHKKSLQKKLFHEDEINIKRTKTKNMYFF